MKLFVWGFLVVILIFIAAPNFGLWSFVYALALTTSIIGLCATVVDYIMSTPVHKP